MSDLTGEQPGFVPLEAAKSSVTQPMTSPEGHPINLITEKYRAQAETRGIKPLEGGEWLVVDGAEYQGYGDTRGKIPSANQQNNLASRLDQVGTYDSNNGTIALVDEQGKLQIGHGTAVNVEVLDKAGYQRSGMWVPFSNGEMPMDPTLRQKYVELREKGREEAKRETTERHLAVYKEVAEKKGIQEVEGGLWMMVDGVEYRQYGPEADKVEVNTDGYNMLIRRVDQVGTYDSNNGRISFVDGQGRLWVGASTKENYEAITKAGYDRGGIWVPFSNGEQPTDREVYEKLRDTLTGRPADQLRVERTARVEEFIELRRRLFGDAAHTPDREQLYVQVADRQETEYINTDELIEGRMKARVETDNAGFERRIYTAHGITFAFRGREELPTYQTLSQSRTQLLGETPHWVSPEDYQAYQAQVNETQRQENAPQHLLATKSLLGVIDLAVQFGSRDSSLAQIRDEVARGIYSEGALTLLDALVATNYVSAAGYLEPKANNNAEAVVLAALLGDSQAQTVVAQKVEALRHIEQQSKVNSERWPSNLPTNIEALKPQELVSVHATRYEPQVGPNGELIVPTTFDATKGKVLRSSVHTSLNHKVQGHMYGSWGDAGYVIISPFESMMEANGVPTVLNTVDTWWSRDPGEPLRFPDATIVKPGGDKVSGLYEIKGNSVEFKSAGLDRQDLVALAEYKRREGDFESLARDIESSFRENFDSYSTGREELQSEWDMDAVYTAIGQYLFKEKNGWGFDGDPALLIDLTATTEGQPVSSLEQKLEDLLERSGATTAIKPEAQDKEVAVNRFTTIVANNIRREMFAEISEIAAQEAIRSKGFEVQRGGMWAWGGSWDVTAQTVALGEQLGTEVAAHSVTPQAILTENFSHQVGAAYEGEGDSAKFDWKKYSPQYHDLVPQIDPKTRRTLYASGLLTARI